MKRTEQTDLVLAWLRQNRTITSQQAWRQWNITRLSDVILKLRKRGYDIETELVPLGKTHFAKYVWHGETTELSETIKQMHNTMYGNLITDLERKI